ncbi:hypothetical protein C3K47_06335 [Solitalea longa]|uniref:Uncharacterized protein n=1 Tax=Solitalea longa TaxID=2079460 RepID=A0A2S5A4B6_9SPHI|nr:hypothetical protein [Solitalea longa]POY37376.1 hypothetical protein C3K47_06335 [Solitalea longa]
MKRIIKTIWICLLLWLSDTVISLVLSLVFGLIEMLNKSDEYGTLSYLQNTLFLQLMRLIFYFALSTLLFYFLSKLRFASKLLLFIVLNAGLYVFISLLYAFVFQPETKELLVHPLFFILIVSAALSPVLLNQWSYFKRLMERY